MCNTHDIVITEIFLIPIIGILMGSADFYKRITVVGQWAPLVSEDRLVCQWTVGPSCGSVVPFSSSWSIGPSAELMGPSGGSFGPSVCSVGFPGESVGISALVGQWILW